MIVLCRTRAQVQNISRTLASAGMPVVERGGMFEQEHIKNVVSLLLLMTDMSGSGLLRLARQSDHPLYTKRCRSTLYRGTSAANKSRYALLYNGEIPATVSLQGRDSLLRLSDIWHDLQQHTTIWSLLAQYLFLETSILRRCAYHS